MDATQSKILGTGIFFIFIFLSGVWLNRSGKPYNAIKFNVHKFIGLAAGAFLILTVYQRHQLIPLNATEIVGVVITILCFIATVIAGGLVSIEKPMPAVITLMHKVFPFIDVLATGMTFKLLLN